MLERARRERSNLDKVFTNEEEKKREVKKKNLKKKIVQIFFSKSANKKIQIFIFYIINVKKSKIFQNQDIFLLRKNL